MTLRFCEASSSRLDEETNALLIRCKSAALSDDDDEDRPDFGDTIWATGLGLTARPAAANDEGAAQLLVDDGVPGVVGAVVGGHDPRAAEVAGELGEGETCLHSTGKGFDSRVFCKDGLVAIVVGDDLVLNLDRKHGVIQIMGFGLTFEMNRDTKEINLSTGSAGIQIGNGVVRVHGELVPGTGNAAGLKVMLGPAAGSPGGGAAAPLVPMFGCSPG